uniref:Arachidonate 5-lipoxygenase-activating protein n=1 Tax=Denticeps clupeoides TaxID=299321 RepID=A0AAY4EJI8_9TELE
MNTEIMENIYLLVLVTLLSVMQNGKYSDFTPVMSKRSLRRKRNCMDLYPTFLAIMWCAGICLSQAAAAFAGLMYLFSRQKYFVGYMGQTSQSTLGYLFGKRVLSFLFLMCLVGIGNFLLVKYWSNDYKEYIQTITNAASTLLLIP